VATGVSAADSHPGRPALLVRAGALTCYL
jgi:hypothetical protein